MSSRVKHSIPKSGAVAFAFSLAAGVVVLINSFALAFQLWIPSWYSTIFSVGPLGISMIGEISSMLMLTVLLPLGFLSAVMLMLAGHEAKYGATGAGAVVLIFAVLSLSVGGGFFIGFIVGVVGGIIALAFG
ncbi:MAG: hypothetical protein ACE5PO_06915 [Candidatus Bathyarchaeia archaeon]